MLKLKRNYFRIVTALLSSLSMVFLAVEVYLIVCGKIEFNAIFTLTGVIVCGSSILVGRYFLTAIVDAIVSDSVVKFTRLNGSEVEVKLEEVIVVRKRQHGYTLGIANGKKLHSYNGVCTLQVRRNGLICTSEINTNFPHARFEDRSFF